MFFGRAWVSTTSRDSSLQFWVPKKLSKNVFAGGIKDTSPLNEEARNTSINNRRKDGM